ncbi:MAG: ClbS/DfsB family four-helix bundle protein, partial [Chloroflexota bacterium]|nr:ClbS/DfsB family four-helix bundle protein [Chloroflexota bacterium]
PAYPKWPEELGSDPEEDVDKTNDWIQETYLDKSWQSVYADWRTQFLRLLELTRQVPEKDLLEPGRYEWMGGQPLSASYLGTYEHHQEHLDDMLARLDRSAAG